VVGPDAAILIRGLFFTVIVIAGDGHPSEVVVTV
jgi:hypothetical protein